MAMKVGELELPDGLHETITFTRPDDWHLHLRDGDAMKSVVDDSAQWCGRALIMPNLQPPVITTVQALTYRKRIMAALPEGSGFQPLMTLYLTDETTVDEIDRAVESSLVPAVKYYPAGATTNSAAGVTDIKKVYRVLERMQKLGMRLCVHGEATDPDVDVFDREPAFLDTTGRWLVKEFPDLRIVFEHITTANAVRFIEVHDKNVVATITAHHLLANRNDMLANGIRPHLYCKPILKTARDQQVLLEAATSGNPKFFLGTDSAPHPKDGASGKAKETACGCAGCFTAPAGIELYAEAFDSVGKLDKLEGFASCFGADFYNLSRNADAITLVREDWEVPLVLPFGNKTVVPFRAGEMVQWKMK